MAKKNIAKKTTTVQSTGMTTGLSRFNVKSFGWRNILMAAGLAFLAPYIIRRVMPLIQGNLANTTPDDFAVAGRDSVRDVADDLNVGGVSGTLTRGVDRVTDHLAH